MISFTTIDSIDYHDDFIETIILLNDGRLASSSNDKTINIIDINNDYFLDLTIDKFENEVPSICQLEDNEIVSFSEDLSIKIWIINKNDFQLVFTIENAHKDSANKVISLTNKRFASCSFDNDIKIWKGSTPYSDIPIAVLNGHTNVVRCIYQLKEQEILVSGSDDETLRVWSLITYQCITTLNKINCYDCHSIAEDNSHLFIGGYEQLTLINKATLVVDMIIKDKEFSMVLSFVILSDVVLCGCQNGKILIYSKITNQIEKIQLDPNYIEPITDMLMINEDTFICSSRVLSINKIT